MSMIGTSLGSYRIVEKLGSGGMGVVYAARHEMIGNSVAIKLMRPHLSKKKPVVARFFNEARAASVIQHAGIARVVDCGFAPDGRAYIIMEYLEGESLGKRIAHGLMPEATVIRFVRQAAGAMAAAHDAGIIHRDLKPDNLHIVRDADVLGGERMKILDFGVAKLASNVKMMSVQTLTGILVGTPRYMSPEQVRAQGDVDGRADIYSLGCVAYHMACGRPPFVGASPLEIVQAHIERKPIPPRKLITGLSETLERTILWMMEKAPEDRPQNMTEVSAALDEMVAPELRTPSGDIPTAGLVPKVTPPVPGSTPDLASERPSPPAALNTTLEGASGALTTRRKAPTRWLWPSIGVLGAAAIAGGIALAVSLQPSSSEPDTAPAAASGGAADPAPAASAGAADPAPAQSAPEPGTRSRTGSEASSQAAPDTPPAVAASADAAVPESAATKSATAAAPETARRSRKSRRASRTKRRPDRAARVSDEASSKQPTPKSESKPKPKPKPESFGNTTDPFDD